MVSPVVADSIGMPAATRPSSGISVAPEVPLGGRTSIARLSLWVRWM